MTSIGWLHMAGTSVSLLTGAFQLMRHKGDALHRRVGYVYVGAMYVGNLTALAIYEFTGRFNVFHALALYSLFNVSMAIRPMLMNPRPYQWKRQHYMWISWSYAGLAAAGFTELLLRVFSVPGWMSALVGTPPVIILAAILIPRFAPALRPPVTNAA